MIVGLLLLAAPLGASAQKLEAKQSVIDCGQILFQRPVTVDFELQNKGNRPLYIRDVKTSCGCATASYPRNGIPQDESFKVSASYDAQQLGHFEKLIAVYSNADDKPLLLTLRGHVVTEVVDYAGDYPFRLGQLSTDVNEIEFDDVNRGDRPFKRIHVFNSSSQTAEPQVMHMPPYLKAEVSPSKIAAGHAGVITLYLDSRRIRNLGLNQTSVYLGAYPGDKVSDEKEITLSAVLLPSFENFNESAREFMPSLVLSARELNLALNGKAKRKGEIEITNKGRTTLEIRSLQMFTEGLEVSLSNKKIEPGGTARLKVTAIAKGLQKARSKPRILMITNDPDNAKVVITVNVK
ncbi:Protein of unknown function [Prevotella sp. KH2C16]|nr:Protein of unknown function [Prevotella sp. KH2C16]